MSGSEYQAMLKMSGSEYQAMHKTSVTMCKVAPEFIPSLRT